MCSKFSALSLLVLCLAKFPAMQAQNRPRAEWGVLAGACNYQGDLAGSHIELRETHPTMGLVYRQPALPRFFLRWHLLAGKLSGSDSRVPSHHKRAYRFRTPFLEAGFAGEYRLSGMFRNRKAKQPRSCFIPYAYLGLCWLLYHPHPEAIPDPATGLIPHPEEFHERGPRASIILAYGTGILFPLSGKSFVTLELGHRPLMHDLLDGISRNANPNANDWYVYGSLGLNYCWK